MIVVNEKLQALLKAINDWASAAQNLALDQDQSAANVQRAVDTVQYEVGSLREELTACKRRSFWLKTAELVIAALTLGAALWVGYKADGVSKKANEIQGSLAQIAASQNKIASSAESRVSVDELADLIDKLPEQTATGGSAQQSPSERDKTLTKLTQYKGVSGQLSIGSYIKLMYWLYTEDRDLAADYWKGHRDCEENCSNDQRASLLQFNLEYISSEKDSSQLRVDLDKAELDYTVICKANGPSICLEIAKKINQLREKLPKPQGKSAPAKVPSATQSDPKPPTGPS